ncbi:MAG: hypothetical protein FWF59_12020 [Turicibacter sp.]|nr:hypothetical protein [Turicibacter sp.]
MSVLIFAITLFVAIVQTMKYNGAMAYADHMEEVVKDVMRTHGILSHYYEDDEFTCTIRTGEE